MVLCLDSGLADAYLVLTSAGGTTPPSEAYPKSNAAARKALELDPSLAHPHAVLGASHMQYDWDFAGAKAEFKKAFDLDPNDATAHQWYALNMGKVGGHEQEALAEANRADELDPLSPIITIGSQAFTSWHDSTTRALPCARSWQVRTRHLPWRTIVWLGLIGGNGCIRRSSKNRRRLLSFPLPKRI
jgi:tetratricopeptide (TPR) repeat protein